jgi:hypothetical protein
VGIASYNKGSDGIEVPKVQKAYAIEDPKTPYLESTAAPTDDIWSAKPERIPTQGGGTQRVIGDRALAQPI